MSPAKNTFALFLLLFTLASCSVISREIRQEAGPAVSFPHLLEHTEGYMGQTVILGGYIISTRNISDRSVITVLQTPLMLGDEPRVKDYSEGRFTVLHDGFLDPEVYTKDRRITVAGVVTPPPRGIEKDCPRGCPFISSRQIHLWRKYHYPAYPYYYDDWYYPRHHFNLYYHHHGYSPHHRYHRHRWHRRHSG